MATKVKYTLTKKSSHNDVYVTESSTFIRGKGSRKSLYVSMIGYGPGGQWSTGYRYKTYEKLKKELSLFWRHPSRKKELGDLSIKRYNTQTGVATVFPMKRVLRDIEQEMLIEKLKGPPRWPL